MLGLVPPATLTLQYLLGSFEHFGYKNTLPLTIRRQAQQFARSWEFPDWHYAYGLPDDSGFERLVGPDDLTRRLA